jgi:hypothetical protein
VNSVVDVDAVVAHETELALLQPDEALRLRDVKAVGAGRDRPALAGWRRDAASDQFEVMLVAAGDEADAGEGIDIDVAQRKVAVVGHRDAVLLVGVVAQQIEPSDYRLHSIARPYAYSLIVDLHNTGRREASELYADPGRSRLFVERVHPVRAGKDVEVAVCRGAFDDLVAKRDHVVLACPEQARRYGDAGVPSSIVVARVRASTQNPPAPIGTTRAKESWQFVARPFFKLSSQTTPSGGAARPSDGSTPGRGARGRRQGAVTQKPPTRHRGVGTVRIRHRPFPSKWQTAGARP